MGLVNERDNGLAAYLSYSSCRRKKPLSNILRGESSSGKDWLQKRPSLLLPPKLIKDCTYMTPKALYYMGRYEWQNKVVLGGERRHDTSPEARDQTAAIRQLLSNGYATIATVLPGLQTRHMRIEGPISYSETTTQDSIFAEDANRVLLLRTDDSEEQTRQVMVAIAREHRGLTEQTLQGREDAQKKHREFLSVLADVDVDVPYGEILADLLPRHSTVMRRQFEYLLGLIDVIAYLHQWVRPRKDDKVVVATLADYELARRLMLGPLAEALQYKKEKLRYLHVDETLRKYPTFTSNMVSQALGESLTEPGGTVKPADRRRASEWIQDRRAANLIKEVQKQRGNKAAMWIWSDKPATILPTVEVVASKVAALTY
jgi:hypothetical protein